MLKKCNNSITALESKSKAPKKKRKSKVPKEIVTKIKELRQKYPNIRES